jgi:anti-sigma-K factor RskA
MSGSLAPDPEREALAGEYVLGVLDAAEMRAVAAEAATDAAFAGLIRDWEARLAPLAMLSPSVEPPASLWSRVEASIGGAKIIDLAARRPGVLRRAGFWQVTTAVSLALAASLAFVAFVPRAAGPRYAATLAPLNGPAPAFLAALQPDGSVRLSRIAAAAVPSDRDLELWALAAGAKVPLPLGVFPAGGTTVHPATKLVPGTQLLVSLEPRGGSPTGLPTGPVLYGGTLIAE